MPKLTVYYHVQRTISNTRPCFCLPDFQLRVSGTENRQVSGSQTCMLQCEVITIILRRLGKGIMGQVFSPVRLKNLSYQPIREQHSHDLSHNYHISPHGATCTILCIFSFRCITPSPLTGFFAPGFPRSYRSIMAPSTFDQNI